MNVLLVDDNQELRQATRELLEILGHQVTEAASGEQALEGASFAELDLLVTDLLMPGIDGVELTRRSLTAKPDLAVLLISSEAEDSGLRDRVSRGDVAFLGKPFSASALGAGIAAAVDASAARSSAVAETPAPDAAASAAPPAPPRPAPRDRHGKGSRLPMLTTATMAAVVAAAAILVLDPGPPDLPTPSSKSAVRGTEIELLEPVGPIAELPVAFRWQPIAEAAVYRLTVRTVDDSILWEADVAQQAGVAAARLDMAAELAGHLLPAVAYTWDIAALNTAGQRVAWSGRIRFRIIPRADEHSIDC